MSFANRSLASDALSQDVSTAARAPTPPITRKRKSDLQHQPQPLLAELPSTPTLSTRSHLLLPQTREVRRLESTSSTHSTASAQRHWIEASFKKRECVKFLPSSSRASRPSQAASAVASEAYEGRGRNGYGKELWYGLSCGILLIS